MNPILNCDLSRRQFLGASAIAAGGLVPSLVHGATSPGNLRLGTFRYDVTPPMGHSLCGGWIKPVVGVDDPLEAIGYVLLGAGKPIVVCVVDWTGLLNSAHIEWRKALAEAAGTTIDRVTVHCVHQHNAPFACLDAEDIILKQGDLPHIVEKDFFQRCLDAGRSAVGTALKQTSPVTHVAHNEARVHKVLAIVQSVWMSILKQKTGSLSASTKIVVRDSVKTFSGRSRRSACSI